MENVCHCVPFGTLSVGDKFSTLEEFERKIKDVQDATHIQLWF